MSVEVPVPHPSTAAPDSPPDRATDRTPGRAADRAVAPVADYAPVFTTTPAPARLRTPGSRPAAARGHWASTAVTWAVLTAFAVLIVSGRVVTEGPVVLVLSRTHGVHLGDLGVLAAWCAGVAAPVVRGVRSRRRTTCGGARPRRG